MTAKPSICDWGVLCKSGVYARIVSCLTPGGLSGASATRLGVGRPALKTVEKSAEGIVGARQVRLVRHSRLKGGVTDRPSRNVGHRRPERYPERGLKERRGRLSKNNGIASGESVGHESGGWGETGVGAAGSDAPVGLHRQFKAQADLICRTAVYVTRSYGGVGGGGREVFPYPK